MRVLKAVLMSIGLLYVVVTTTPLVGWWSSSLAGSWNDPKGDILIVLGSEIQSADGMIGLSTYWRSVYAVRVWREGGFREMILVGGPSENWTIAGAMKRFVLSQGVPEEAVKVEGRSLSTRENALYTRDLLVGTPGRKILLTSDYHMFRALRTFRKAGLEVAPRPVPDGLKQAARWQTRWPMFIGLVVETGKIGYYWARGWI